MAALGAVGFGAAGLGAAGLAGAAGAGSGTGASKGRRGAAQPANHKAKNNTAQPMGRRRLTVALARKETIMWLILLEALGAGLILVLIVWWTMSGRTEDTPDDKQQD